GSERGEVPSVARPGGAIVNERVQRGLRAVQVIAAMGHFVLSDGDLGLGGCDQGEAGQERRELFHGAEVGTKISSFVDGSQAFIEESPRDDRKKETSSRGLLLPEEVA